MAEIVPDELFYTVGVSGTVICTAGIVCNTLSLLVFARRKSEHAVPVFFMALACFDLSYVITCLVAESIPIIRLRAGDVAKIGTVDWVFHGLNSLAATGSIFTSTALTIDQSIALEKPFRWSVICSRNRAMVVVLVIFTAATMVNLPLLIEGLVMEEDDLPCFNMMMMMDFHGNSTDSRGDEVDRDFQMTNINATSMIPCKSREMEEHQNLTSSELSSWTSLEECAYPEYDDDDDSSPQKKHLRRQHPLYQTLYVWVLLPVCKLGIPVVIIVATTVRFLLKLRRNKVGIASNTTASPTSSTTTGTKTTPTIVASIKEKSGKLVEEKSGKLAKSRCRIAVHVTVMAAITVFAHGMLTTSYFVMSQSGTVYVNYCSDACMVYIGISHAVVALSSSLKLILVSVFNKAFREEIKSILTCQFLAGVWKKRSKIQYCHY